MSRDNMCAKSSKQRENVTSKDKQNMCDVYDFLNNKYKIMLIYFFLAIQKSQPEIISL